MKLRIRIEYRDERIVDSGVIEGQEWSFDLSEFIGMPKEFQKQVQRCRAVFINKLNGAIDTFESEMLEKLK